MPHMGPVANAALATDTQLLRHVCTARGGGGTHVFKGAKRVGLHRTGLTDMEM